MLLNAFDHVFREQAAYRTNNAVSIFLSCCLGINFQSEQKFHCSNACNVVAYGDTENLTDVGCRVGADKQHSFAVISKLHGRCACYGRFPDTAFTGKEKEAWWLFKKEH